jgi:hypothetical protein
MPLRKRESPLRFVRRLRHRTTPRAPSFMKRHSRLISFLGALIVFVTFIVKEGLADRWKGEASALSALESSFATRQEINRIHYVLTEMESRLDRNNNEEAFIRDKILDGTSVLSSLTSYEYLLETALDRIPHEQLYYANDVKLLEYEVDGAEEIWKSILKKRKDLEERKERGGHPDSYELLDAIRRVSEKIKDIEIDVTRLYSRLLNEARRLRKENEDRSEWAWWIAAVLYTLGWSLAVVGRLYDVPVSSE